MKRAFVLCFLICFVFIILGGAVSAYSEDEAFLCFLSDQGIRCSKNSSIKIVTNEDNSQHIEISEEVVPGIMKVTILSCVGEVDSELVSIKLFPEAQPGSKMQVDYPLRTSNGFSEVLGNTCLTVTMTAYYSSVWVWSPESAVVYAPTGVTGKIHRSSGSATATSFYGYFAIPGRLVTSNYTITNTEHNYLADFDIDNPVLDVVYGDYTSLPSGYPYIWPYPSSDNGTPGLGFIVEVAGYTRPFEYSVYPFSS